ncbi:MAG: alpha/beta fold hydrolase [Desulfobacterales bacterium]|nr:alpha/beta fold hydrolase [Desulfobacterales bacterium]
MLAVFAAAAPLAASQDASPACVILLHGLGRRAASMTPMAKDLRARGFRVYNIAYPSTEAAVETLTADYLEPAVNQSRQDGCPVVHMVAHSLGAVMIRQYLQTQSLPAGSRIVMLAPPNQGSEVVDTLGPWFFYRWFLGPSGLQLGTGPESLPNRLAPVEGNIGVITGDASWNLFLSLMIPGPDDGKVSVESAKLKGMDDFLVLPVTHTFIMQDAEVMAQTAHFLSHGRFDHHRPEDAPRREAGSSRKRYRQFER